MYDCRMLHSNSETHPGDCICSSCHSLRTAAGPPEPRALAHCSICTGDRSCTCACPACRSTATQQLSTCFGCGQPARGGFCGSGRCVVYPCVVEPPKQERHILKYPACPNLYRIDGDEVLNVTQLELARLLFEAAPYRFEQAVLRAEVPPTSMQGSDNNKEAQKKIRRVFDIMWNGTESKARERAEERAALVFARARASR